MSLLDNDSSETCLQLQVDATPDALQCEANNEVAKNRIIYIEQHIIRAEDDRVDQSATVSEPNHIDASPQVTYETNTTVGRVHNETLSTPDCRDHWRLSNANRCNEVLRSPEELVQIANVPLPERIQVNHSDGIRENAFPSKDEGSRLREERENLLNFNEAMEIQLRRCVMHHLTLLT